MSLCIRTMESKYELYGKVKSVLFSSLSIWWILYFQCISVVHDISEYMLFWINTTPLFVLPHLFIKNLCALLSSHLASIPSLQIKQMSSRNQLSSKFWQDISTWWYAQNYLELCCGSNTHVQRPEITGKFHFVSLMTDVGPWFFTISILCMKYMCNKFARKTLMFRRHHGDLKLSQCLCNRTPSGRHM